MKGAHTFQSVKNLLDKRKKMGMGVMGLVKNQLMPSAAPDQPTCGHLAILAAIYVALSFNQLAICTKLWLCSGILLHLDVMTVN